MTTRYLAVFGTLHGGLRFVGPFPSHAAALAYSQRAIPALPSTVEEMTSPRDEPAPEVEPTPAEQAEQERRIAEMDALDPLCQWSKAETSALHDSVLTARRRWRALLDACGEFESRYC